MGIQQMAQGAEGVFLACMHMGGWMLHWTCGSFFIRVTLSHGSHGFQGLPDETHLGLAPVLP